MKTDENGSMNLKRIYTNKKFIMHFESSKIYVIRSPNTEEYYIGATTQKLHDRIQVHRRRFRSSNFKETDIGHLTDVEKVFIVMNHGDELIQLVEDFECKYHDDLNNRLHEYIKLNPACVNKKY
jgi:hypothetical protein